MTAWAYIENIVLVVCATALAYFWNSGWPFLLLLFCNYKTTTKQG